MSYVEKYAVSKRGQEVGPYTAMEVIDLLRMKELSTIHKVKVSNDWVLISDFIDLFEKERREEVMLSMESLSKEHKEVLLLRYYSDLSYAEIAQTLDVKLGTVMSRLSRARRNLLEILDLH